MLLIVANAQADFQRDLALFGKVSHCVWQPAEINGLSAPVKWYQKLMRRHARCATLQCTAVAAMQMSTFLQFQSGSHKASKTDVAVQSGAAAAWAKPLELKASDNKIAVRSTAGPANRSCHHCKPHDCQLARRFTSDLLCV
jgi:hypothetical protein